MCVDIKKIMSFSPLSKTGEKNEKERVSGKRKQEREKKQRKEKKEREGEESVNAACPASLLPS